MGEIKLYLLKMLGWFHEYCVKHSLSYYLVEGTMLGAARHKGFIPWDDDIDVAMPRTDYERLKTLMAFTIHDERYMLETEESEKEDYLYPFAKLYDITTTIIEDRRIKVRRGLYIDVFPLDGIGNTRIEAIKNYRPIGLLQDVLASRVVVVRDGRKWYKNLSIKLFQLLPTSLIDEKRIINSIIRKCKSRSYNDSVLVGNLVSSYRYKEIMPKDYYGTPTLYRFENLFVYGVENYDAYLSQLYGDWRKLPPENERVSTHLRDGIDLHTSFMK